MKKYKKWLVDIAKKLQKCFRAQGHEEMGPIFERINTMLEHFTIKLLPKLREVQAKGEIMVVVVEKGKTY